MTSSNLPAVQEAREAASTALDKGDREAANIAYSRELQALAGQAVETTTERTPSSAPPAMPSGITAHDVMAGLRQVDPEGVQEAEEEWRRAGTSAEKELPYASWFIARTLPAHLHDKLNIYADQLVGLAAAGRWYYHDDRPAPQQQRGTTMKATNETAIEDELTAIREQIDEAQARGQSQRANRLYAQEQSIIAARRGNQTVVNGRRTA